MELSSKNKQNVVEYQFDNDNSFSGKGVAVMDIQGCEKTWAVPEFNMV